MKNKPEKNGFSLVELLVAMTIIVAIVSMLYGSYFATSKSTQVYQSRIALSQQQRKLLGQMARQLRCSYAGYLDSNQDNPDGEILQLVTTSGFLGNQVQAGGLFEAAYKFNKNKNILFLSQRKFTGTLETIAQKRNWQQIAGNISQFELKFFDGQQWLKSWSFNDRKKLPSAVKFDVTFEDENSRLHRYGTTVYLYCRENQNEETKDKI
jgi:prepilin-type N-terminal cleavage/methylation domain-containing protein